MGMHTPYPTDIVMFFTHILVKKGVKGQQGQQTALNH